MAERASKNDVMWSSTVRDLGGLYALKLCAGIVLVPRIYLVGRYIRNVFGFNTNEVKLIGARPCAGGSRGFSCFWHVGSLQNVDAASAWFVRKFLFRFYPAAFSAFILIALWTLTAWAVDQAERSIANGDLAEYVDVLWLVVVTIVRSACRDLRVSHGGW
ncbi:hypothetical protein DYB32_001828 [Aphanomyces invadans]|uniref:Uncharacterized protein n=1 Tax=Aphanomyces invadans TaxID=157072 RepID=A0A3R6YGF2_9STRA|nr:hypothetical protein DYB32_001828 [Aphanomyces invadans]